MHCTSEVELLGEPTGDRIGQALGQILHCATLCSSLACLSTTYIKITF